MTRRNATPRKPAGRKAGAKPAHEGGREHRLTALTEVVQAMVCPVQVAVQHAKHCEHLRHAAERDVELTRFAYDMYTKRPNTPAIGGLLGRLVKSLERHAHEYVELARAFTLASNDGDHDIAHDHVNPRDLGRLYEILFVQPSREERE